MPHGFALVWQGFIKYLPTIGLIFIGLVALALVVYIIFKYRKANHFWRNLGVAAMVVTLFGWGYWGIHRYSTPLTLGSNILTIDIIKDTGQMTASADSQIKLAMKWTYGHNTYANLDNSAETASVFGQSVSAAADDDQIKLFMNDQEITSESAYFSTSRSQEEDYSIVAEVDPNIAAGSYRKGLVLAAVQRDSIMPASHELSESDLIDSTGIPTDQQFVAEVPCEKADDEEKCREEEENSNEDTTNTDVGLHKWLNAPDPIRRENIKRIEFKTTKFSYDAEQTPEANGKDNPWAGNTASWGVGYDPGKDVRDNYDLCWDISAGQSGEVIACAIERARTEDWPSGFNLFEWFAGTFKISYEMQCLTEEGILPFITETDANGNVTDVSNPDFEECMHQKEVEDKIKVHLGVYDIVISQNGGVSAPSDSSGLFYYTGQNTNYCMYGPRAIVDPVMGDARRNVISRLDGSGRVTIADLIDAYKQWKAKIKLLLETDPNYEEAGFFAQLFLHTAEDKVLDFFKSCHTDFVEVPTTIKLTGLFTDDVTNMSHMFDGANFAKISERIKLTDGTRWFNTDNVEDMSYMFANITINHAGEFDSEETGMNFGSVKNMAGMFSSSRFEKITFALDLGEVEDMRHMFSAIAGKVTIDNDHTHDSTWREFTIGVGEVDINNLSTFSVTNMSHMFEGARAKITASPNKFLTSNVTDMSFMFSGAMDSSSALELSHFRTHNVTDMSGMFLNTRFSSVDLSSFDTSNVTGMSRMFEACDTKELDISTFDTSQVTTMNDMFFNAKAETVNFGKNFKTDNVTNMSGMFANTVFKPVSEFKNTTPLKFNTSNVTDMNNMFFNAKNLDFVNLKSFDTSQVTDMSYMFGNFRIDSKPQETFTDENGEEETTSGEDDGRKTDRLYVTDFKHKDEETNSYLINPVINFALSLTGAGEWKARFIAILDAQKRELNNWRDQDPADYGKNYNTRTKLDLTSFDTSSVENMEGMFIGAQYPSIDINYDKFDTSNVKNMSWMYAMLNANDLNFKGRFNTSSVETMEGMFAGTHYNKTLKLSSFSHESLKNTKFMFAYSNILDINLGNFNPKAASEHNYIDKWAEGDKI